MTQWQNDYIGPLPFWKGRNFSLWKMYVLWLWIIFPHAQASASVTSWIFIYWILYSMLVTHITWLLTKCLILQEKQWLMSMRLTGLTMYHVIQKLLSWWNSAMVHWRNSQPPAGRTTQPIYANTLQVWRGIGQDFVYVLITTATNTQFCFCDHQETLGPRASEWRQPLSLFLQRCVH